jgi:radical SAM superfamily enzyme YgiQ (UPF0313 family)
MKITLVYPDYIIYRSFSRATVLRIEKGGWYSEGVAALSASLKEKGAEVNLLHITTPPQKEEFERRLIETKPDVVGFTVRTSAFTLVSEWSRWVKKAIDVPILWGGYHPTLAPEECMNVSYVDAVVRGDGDMTIYPAAHALANGSTLAEIPGVWYREKGEIKNTSVGPLVKKLDELPIPNFSIFKLEDLISTKTKTALGMLSRGCPYQCTYCTNYAFRSLYPNKNNYLRYRSPEGCMEYIERLRSWFPGVRELRFLDNVFGIDMKWLEEFTKLYKSNVDLPFSCDERIELVSEDRVKLLKDAGCTQVYIGVESGDEELRKMVLERTMSNKLLKDGFELLHKYGIRTLAFNMVGLPNEDRCKALSTIKLNAELRTDDSIVSVFSPYPSTVLYEVSIRKGYIKEPIDYTQFTFLSQPDFKNSEVAFIAVYFNFLRRFYRRFGTTSALGRMTDRIILSSSLPMNFTIRVAEDYAYIRDNAKSFLRTRAPGLFRFMRRLLKGRK